MAVHESVLALREDKVVQKQVSVAKEVLEDLEQDMDLGELNFLDLLDCLARLGYYIAPAELIGRNLASDAYIASLPISDDE